MTYRSAKQALNHFRGRIVKGEGEYFIVRRASWQCGHVELHGYRRIYGGVDANGRDIWHEPEWLGWGHSLEWSARASECSIA